MYTYRWQQATMKREIVLLIIVVLTGCCRFEYEDIDFLFNVDELEYFSTFEEGDTIYYKSSNNDIDTILIHEISPTNEDPKSACGRGLFMNRRPVNYKSVTIRFLPQDKWHDTNAETSKEGKVKTSISYQELFTIAKFPLEKEVNYDLSFKNFHSYGDSLIGRFHKKPIILNGQEWREIFEVVHAYPERIRESRDIKVVYWTVKEGLIAYQNKSGELWTKVLD